MLRYEATMKRSSRKLILVVAVIVVLAALLGFDLKGFRVWELPFFVLGGAVLVYALFSWHPS